MPGLAFGNGHTITGAWIHQGRVGFVPAEVAVGLRGKHFKNWRSFQEAFWLEVGKHPRLLEGFSPANQTLIKAGEAPFASMSQQIGAGAANQRFNLHHLKSLSEGGSLYDIDNIIVASPFHHLKAF